MIKGWSQREFHFGKMRILPLKPPVSIMWHPGALFISQSKCQRTYINTNKARSALDPPQWLFVISTMKDCHYAQRMTRARIYISKHIWLNATSVHAFITPYIFQHASAYQTVDFPEGLPRGQRGYKDLTGPGISFIFMSLKPKWHLTPLSQRLIDVVSQERTLRRCNLHPHAGLEGAAERIRGPNEYFILA